MSPVGPRWPQIACAARSTDSTCLTQVPPHLARLKSNYGMRGKTCLAYHTAREDGKTTSVPHGGVSRRRSECLVVGISLGSSGQGAETRSSQCRVPAANARLHRAYEGGDYGYEKGGSGCMKVERAWERRAWFCPEKVSRTSGQRQLRFVL